MDAKAEREAVLRYLQRSFEGCQAGAEAARALGGHAVRVDWISRGAALREAAVGIEQGHHRLKGGEPPLTDDERWGKVVQAAASHAVVHALQAAGPKWDPRLDVAVAGAVGWARTEEAGWQPRRVYVFDAGELRHVNKGGELPAFTASLDAAAALVPAGWSWRVGTTPSGGYAVVGTHLREHLGATPALALCIAVLETLNG